VIFQRNLLGVLSLFYRCFIAAKKIINVFNSLQQKICSVFYRCLIAVLFGQKKSSATEDAALLKHITEI